MATLFLSLVFLSLLLIFAYQFLNLKGLKKRKGKFPTRVNDATVIDIAIRQNGVLTNASLAHHANIPVKEADQRLNQLHEEQIFSIDVSEEGLILYKLRDRSLLGSKSQ
jgi:hypothetical protein